MARKRRLTDYTNVDVTVEGEASGAYGQVYFGPDQRSGGKWAALKTLRPHVLRDARVQALFTKEALTWLSMWPHANLLPAHGVTEIDDQVYIVLPYARRGSLLQVLYPRRHGLLFGSARGKLPLPQSLLWAQMIAAGLDRLHTPEPSMLREHPIIHRDLKPDNILIQWNGLAQITDLGLAKVVETFLEAAGDTTPEDGNDDVQRSQPWRTPRGMTFAAVPYRAPEQWEGTFPIDTYTDMYAFGIILSELVAGRHPFVDLRKVPKNYDWRSAHLRQSPRPLTDSGHQLPDALLLVYNKCLAKDPAARPSAREALHLLQEAAGELGHRPYQIPEILAHTPDNEASIWQNLSTVYARFRYFERALDWNDWALQRDPDSRTALLTRANILSQVGGVDEAIKAYEKALAVTPETDRVALNTVYSNYGTMLGRARRFDEAEVAFVKAVEAVPEAADTWNNRGTNQMSWALHELNHHNRRDALNHVELGIGYMRRARDLNKNDPHYVRAVSEMEKLRERILKSPVEL